MTAPCDCDDGRNAVHPGATETCNNRDDDCDGVVDEGTATTTTAQGVVDPGAEAYDLFGHALAVVGDVDGDGVQDFAVGASQDDLAGYTDRGSVALFSGATRALLCRALDPDGASNDQLGWSVAAVGDLNHDGTPDFAAGARQDSTPQGTYAGSVAVFSGAGCGRLLKLTDPGGASSDYLGSAVAGLGDVNGDGTPDIAAGALYDDTAGGTNAGSVVVFSGGSGAVLYKTFDPGGAANDYLGSVLAAVGDVDRDGITDFAAGAPYDDALGGSDAGSVVLFSGADGTKLRKLADPGGAGYDYLGVSVAGIGDVDGDLVPDVVAGVYYDSTPQGSYAGSVALFSGASGALIRKLTDPAGAANDRLGTAVAALPDVNGDGIPEVVAGAPQNDAAATDAGRVVVFSGADGAVLQRFTDPAALGTDLLGTALAAIGDLGGGGKPEILAGAEGAPLPEGQDAGKVLVFSFEADCDGDGVTALLDCDDGDGAVEPGAPERCNAVDDDCDGLVDEDDDGDGYAACAGDCNNADPRVFPGAPERCNAADDDCDGSTDEGPDADGDGVTAPCDCDDGRNGVHPGATESCNNRDDDCDGVVDEGTATTTTAQGVVDPGAEAYDLFGHALAVVGDVDGDGVEDFAVGASQDDLAGYTDRGSVALFSGATRALLCRALDPDGASNDQLGWSVAAVGDLNHDGTPDFAAGARQDSTPQGTYAGSVAVFSGAGCGRLLKLTDPGGASSDYLGSAVAGLGDVNGDGTPDIAAGALYDDTAGGTNAGSVVVFSGGSGAMLYKTFDPGGAANDYLGSVLAAVGDVDRDGITDFAAGAPYDDALGGSDAGSVVLFSGADGTKLRKLADPGGAGYDYLGVSVAGIGDVDGDLVPDVVAGVYYDSTPQGSYAGSVALFSGASGALIRKLTDPAGAANDRLGTAVAALPDVNGDGIPEVVAGAPQNDAAATDAGRVVVFSGADGAVLQRFTDPAALGTDLLGTALAAIGDLGGGGKPEILAGAEGAPLPEGQDAGKVLVFSFEADCDGDGVTALLDCDDGDGAVEPGALERCNAVDDDCDGEVDEDDDGDGYAACAGDCDNADPRVFPGAPERCNAADDDCDGSTDEGPDGDGDGVTAPCDCDDGRNAVHPGATESCNNRDDDCDGVVDEGTATTTTAQGVVDPASGGLRRCSATRWRWWGTSTAMESWTSRSGPTRTTWPATPTVAASRCSRARRVRCSAGRSTRTVRPTTCSAGRWRRWAISITTGRRTSRPGRARTARRRGPTPGAWRSSPAPAAGGSSS